MKTKPIPVAVSLAAGFITCIISFLNQVTLGQFVRNFCLAIVIFYVLGALVGFLLHKFIPLEENKAAKEEIEEQTAKEETVQEKEAGQTEETENLDEEDQA